MSGYLDEYISTYTTSETSYPILHIRNATSEIFTGLWQNDVFMYYWNAQTFDLIYSHQYNATQSEQIGPTTTKAIAFVESRKNWNRNSNRLGFFDISYGSGTTRFGKKVLNWNTPDATNSHIRRDAYSNPGDGMGFDEILGEKIANRQFVVQAGN